MPRRAFPELNPDEKDAARAIAGLIDIVRRDDDLLHQHWEPVPGSRLWQDDQKVPHYPISDFATQQFATIIGCIEALATWVGYEDHGDHLSLSTQPFGGYALLRSAIESAAWAMWVLYPENYKLRIRRRLAQQAEEWRSAQKFAKSTGRKSSDVQSKLDRIQRFGDEAGVPEWNVFISIKADAARVKAGKPPNRPPTITELLKYVERHRQEARGLSFYSTWQLASGSAHGKFWVNPIVQDLVVEEGSKTKYGATARATTKYGMLLLALDRCVEGLQLALTRFIELGSHEGQRPTPVNAPSLIES